MIIDFRLVRISVVLTLLIAHLSSSVGQDVGRATELGGNRVFPLGIVSKDFAQKLSAMDQTLKSSANPSQTLIDILMTDADWERRSLAAQRMQRKTISHWENFIPILIQATKDPHPYVRRDSVGALRQLGVFPSAVEAAMVERLTLDDFGFIRLQAALTLGSIRPVTQNIINVLENALLGTSLEGRIGAADALAQIGPPATAAVPSLVKSLEISDWGYQISSALNALIRIKGVPPAALPKLLEVARQSKSDSDFLLCGQVAKILETFGKPVTGQLVSALSDPSICVQVAGAVALDQIGSVPSAEQSLVRKILGRYQKYQNLDRLGASEP